MKQQASDFCRRLGISFCDGLVPYFEDGLRLKSEYKNRAIDIERLRGFNDKYKFYREHFPLVEQASAMIADDDDMLTYVYVLISVIGHKADLKYLPVPDRQRVDTDFLPLFSLLWYIEDMVAAMEKRGLPFEVISDTLHGFEAETDDHLELYGRRGISPYVGWFLHFLRGEIIRVGRLNFEMTTFSRPVRVYEKDGDIKILIDGADMHKDGMMFGSAGQTDEGSKYRAEISESDGSVTGYAVNALGECVPEKVTICGYREVLRRGDPIINVHIPAKDPFNARICEESYENARRIFAKHYPEFEYKAFCCFSWMMEKRLYEIMGRDTNITLFADKFHAFPQRSAAKDVYGNLFHVLPDTPTSELPENTSMQRKVKAYMLEGKYFYEKGGVFL